MTERRACRLANQPRGTQRYRAIRREDEDALTQAIIQLASQYGRYGYRRITALLKRAGWRVGKDRVERIWRREGLKVPQKQKPRRRLWLNDGSCVRLRPTHRNHVWSYDFVSARTHDGRAVRILNLIDEHTRESLLVRAERRWSSATVSEQTFYRWKAKYAGLEVDQVRQMAQLQEENLRLKKLVAELSLDKTMLQDVLSKKW
jgi:putative transposase